jgi:hypothetical protein
MRISCIPSVLVLLGVLGGTPASAARIDVSPGPGTPLQDAIDSAAAGDTVFVHNGAYPEAIVIDRSLRVVTDSAVDLGPAGGPLASSCDTPYTLEITAPRVIISGRLREYPALNVWGGSVASIGVHDAGKVVLKHVTTQNACPGGMGIDVRAVTRFKSPMSAFWALNQSDVPGAPGCRVSALGDGRVDLLYAMCRSTFLFRPNLHFFGGPAILVQDPGQVRVKRSVFHNCGAPAAVLEGASGVTVQASDFVTCAMILGEPDHFPGVSLDAASTGNRVRGSVLSGPIVDAGSGNCFVGNEDDDGDPWPDACPP